MMGPESPRPEPNQGRASLARRKVDSKSSPRSAIDVVRRSELLRLGAITHGSPHRPWSDRRLRLHHGRSDCCRFRDPMLDPKGR